jgi:hypothetical protein
MTATILTAWMAVLLAVPAATLPGFHRSPWFRELVCEEWIEGDVRILVNAPADFDTTRPTRLIVYASPNGNSIEQTLGCAPIAGSDWHFDIQHVAAQVRRLRELTPDETIVLACVEAEGLSWPAWRQRHADSPARARRVVEWVRGLIPRAQPRVTLSGHSGGGSFMFAFLDAANAIPEFVDRIGFLDANYSYSDESHHGDKLLTWLRGHGGRRLAVVAYDDRNITLNGKLVVGPTGGTYRATERMVARFGRELPLAESTAGTFVTRTGLDGRAVFHVHPNPENRILHTALVGEMNGLLAVLTAGAPAGPRAYTKWVQPAPGIPPRPADALGGAAFMKSIAALPRGEREEAIAAEIGRGNLPDFLRQFQTVTVRAKDAAGHEHAARYEVMPDYLAVGSDADFVRVPMSPLTAQRLADAFGCALPTRKVADDVYRQAAVKLDPIPLTEAREAVETFVRHNALIEEQRRGQALGRLAAGIKKDVVVTNRLGERPDRVAIYGWHKADGTPIQPLTIVHVNWYVDYSHGVRLMRRAVTVDGRPRDVRHVLHMADLCGLLSDEGPLTHPSY